ncbi:hypothetical protein [Persephonella sp.]
MIYRNIIMILTVGITLTVYGKDFIISFGEGGFKSYKIIDNTCYGYVMGYPKTDKTLPNIMNEAIMRSLKQAKNSYEKKAEGFINIKVMWQFIDKKMIIYQLCGDIVRRK